MDRINRIYRIKSQTSCSDRTNVSVQLGVCFYRRERKVRREI
jgi:hypothetical protein